ncbi:MmgE/PrpD family protein [Microvirga subterranea]|uniref:2-methylcitrate dehydratase PrpD n=1 Tax=Microvirga subterranea TaxID=186651 RepID=A0A370HE91_9HYPH|nr:MmgE/PrpD family protein [Microvirga subterranea]RDI54881.1 2-methylcitrate dehydratase PrpD [Microvirga subterranea]
MTIVTQNVIPASVLLQAGQPDWLRQWGEFAAKTRFSALPAPVVERTKLVLLDCIGAIAAGMQEPEMRTLVGRLAQREAGEGQVPVIGSGRRMSALLASLLNGTAGTMLELDEGNQYARGHPGIHVVPAALAAGERLSISGADLLLAVALGYEIGSRIGIASKLRVTMHPHGTWGTVGAALTAAKLEGATADQMVETINIASSFGLSTSRRTMLEGGTVRNSYAGFSNQLGLMAWELQASGFVGETDGVGTVYGTVIAENFQPDEMVLELGERWEIARNYFKRHAACRYTHGALDALGDIVRQAGGSIDPAAIETIEVDTYVWAAQLDSAEPKNMLAAKFSLPFALATSIVNGAATVPAFREEAQANTTARDLARRVSVREDASLTAMLPGLRPARVRVCFSDGRTLSAEVLTNKGDTEDPYSPDDVRDKFRELAEPVWGGEHVDRIIAEVDGLDGASDIHGLTGLLARAPQHGWSQ